MTNFEDEDESVYNLIEKPIPKVQKPPMYRSKYPHDTAPTASTFALKNTTKPGVANVAGETLHPDVTGGKYKIVKPAATMGPSTTLIKQENTMAPTNFLKKHEKDLKLPAPQKFDYRDARKPPVPAKDEKPIMGLKSDKNFVTSNAVENILSVAKKTNNDPVSYVHKPEYGKVPEYLHKIKKEIADEYAYIKHVQEQQQANDGKDVQLLSEEEREELLNALRTKWNELNSKYQSYSFGIPAARKPEASKKFEKEGGGAKVAESYSTLDRTKVVKKESLESEMDEIEKQIQALSKKHIFVYKDA